ncbi:MAG: dCMP deaminase family protein [Candidatus Diapherotrites archaeon]|nr:dCMP deaminase family protein [Candidatus Diapherotrites archaeon]
MENKVCKIEGKEKEFVRPSWDEYFILAAVLIASRAACLKFKSGAVVVKNKRIVASGYNGPAPGVPSPFELGYCRKDVVGVDWSKKSSGHCLSTHAEANAIVQNHQQDLTGASMYCLHFPCNECAKLIASCGIKEVIFLKNYKEEVSRSEEIFNNAGVKFKKISIDHKASLRIIEDVLTSIRE